MKLFKKEHYEKVFAEKNTAEQENEKLKALLKEFREDLKWIDTQFMGTSALVARKVREMLEKVRNVLSKP
ncbi:MAG: hypothetical protein OIN85_01080 [Candidatus Methanoperedens sp.]|nr:hypothetical protein [Candidatus Methanoperedens sp.]